MGHCAFMIRMFLLFMGHTMGWHLNGSLEGLIDYLDR